VFLVEMGRFKISSFSSFLLYSTTQATNDSFLLDKKYMVRTVKTASLAEHVSSWKQFIILPLDIHLVPNSEMLDGLMTTEARNI
jgi:hypothetical protein